MSWITASSRLGGLLRLHRKISSGQSGIPVVQKRDPALPVWNFLYIFAECNLCRVFGVCSISLMQRAEKSNFKQKNIDRVHQKKIKSSTKEYVTWKRFKLWTMKNFFVKTISQECGYGFFTKSPRIIVVHDFSTNLFNLKRGILPSLTKKYPN